MSGEQPGGGVRVDAFLADVVQAKDGKLDALGLGWNHLVVADVPALQPQLGLGLVLRVPNALCGIEHTLEVRLEDPDGTPVPLGDDRASPTVSGTFRLDEPPAGTAVSEQLMPLGLNLSDVRFAGAGAFRFVIAINGSDAKIVPFDVLLRDQWTPAS